MESRLNGANYATVTKSQRWGRLLTLDVDVMGDPLRPKEAVVTASGPSKAPRLVSCKACRVTAGFGVHTWVALDFELPRGAHEYENFTFVYNPGWSSTRVVGIISYDSSTLGGGAATDIQRTAVEKNPKPSFSLSPPPRRARERPLRLPGGTPDFARDFGGGLGAPGTAGNEKDDEDIRDRDDGDGHNDAPPSSNANYNALLDALSFSKNVPSDVQKRMEEQSYSLEPSSKSRAADLRRLPHDAESEQNPSTFHTSWTEASSAWEAAFSTSRHRPFIDSLQQRLGKLNAYRALDRGAFVDRLLYADIGVLLTLLPLLSPKNFAAALLAKSMLPRLCDELERTPQEAIAEKLSAHLLRICREFRRYGLPLAGPEAVGAEEFAALYSLVKRLAKSVRLSRMQGATATRCADIRDLLAIDFGS
ncbi:unnamed protein product [Amoebophrya sp. A25]|nr:unnamed protein product [Amoebophrya sp. A25]|eukprot:GSA25T00000095001.1